MSVRISITKFGKAFSKRTVTENVIKPALQATLDDSIGILGSNTPIDTGRAREGWRIEKSLQFVSNDVPYVKFLDDGTIKMKAFNITKKSIPLIKIQFKINIENAIGGLNR